MKSKFFLFSSHLDLAHSYWKALLSPTDTVVDATCGNGHDTLQLAHLVPKGNVFALDIQEEAIVSTQALLKKTLTEAQLSRVQVLKKSHATFPQELLPESVRLIVYNLGYLPGHNKSFTTEVSSTLISLQNALPLILSGGAISMTCYPGHAEGAKEEASLLETCARLDPTSWSVYHHKSINRIAAPSLLLIQRKVI